MSDANAAVFTNYARARMPVEEGRRRLAATGPKNTKSHLGPISALFEDQFHG